MKRFFKRLTLTALAILCIGLLIPQNLKMPVVGAGSHSYNHETFWYGGWGSSVVHKGVDVFARKGTRINSSTIGLVLATGELSKGGKYVLILGPKWRMHYYAHLNEITLHRIPSSLRIRKLYGGEYGKCEDGSYTPALLHRNDGSLSLAY